MNQPIYSEYVVYIDSGDIIRSGMCAWHTVQDQIQHDEEYVTRGKGCDIKDRVEISTRKIIRRSDAEITAHTKR